MYPPKLPGGGGVEYFGFQVTGMTEWGQKSTPPSQIPRASNKTPKIPCRISESIIPVTCWNPEYPLGLNSDYNHKDFLEFLTSQHSQQSKIYISSHTIKLRSNGS